MDQENHDVFAQLSVQDKDGTKVSLEAGEGGVFLLTIANAALGIAESAVVIFTENRSLHVYEAVICPDTPDAPISRRVS